MDTKIPFEIYHNNKISLSFWDRLRVLFGQKININSTIGVDKEIEIIQGYGNVHVWVNPLIKRKHKGGIHIAMNEPVIPYVEEFHDKLIDGISEQVPRKYML